MQVRYPHHRPKMFGSGPRIAVGMQAKAREVHDASLQHAARVAATGQVAAAQTHFARVRSAEYTFKRLGLRQELAVKERSKENFPYGLNSLRS